MGWRIRVWKTDRPVQHESNTYEQRVCRRRKRQHFRDHPAAGREGTDGYTNPAGGTDASVKRIKPLPENGLAPLHGGELARHVGNDDGANGDPDNRRGGLQDQCGRFPCHEAIDRHHRSPVLKKGGTAILSADFTLICRRRPDCEHDHYAGRDSGDAITID